MTGLAIPFARGLGLRPLHMGTYGYPTYVYIIPHMAGFAIPLARGRRRVVSARGLRGRILFLFPGVGAGRCGARLCAAVLGMVSE